MYIKSIVVATLLLNIVSACAMNEEELFWQAVEDKKYDDVKSFLDYNPSLIGSKGSPFLATISIMSLNDLKMLQIFLSHNPNIIYNCSPSLGSPIYRAIWNNQTQMVQVLLDYHKTNGEPEDLSEFGFYGKKTLEAVKSEKTNAAIKLAFNELQERKRIRDEKARDLNCFVESKQKRLIDYVQLRPEMRQLEFLASLTRDTR